MTSKNKNSENGIDTIDACIKTLKYGDSDQSSKKRKNEEYNYSDSDKSFDSNSSTTKYDEERNNYKLFQEMAFDSDLNSTFLTSTASNQSFLNEKNDLNNDSSSNRSSSIQKTDNNHVINSLELSLSCAKTNNHFITKSPSGTSYGFENTFRILEKQIIANQKKRSYLRRISEEYIPNLSSLMHDDDHDASSSSTLTSLSYNSIESRTTDSLDLFELELEAIQRLQQKNYNSQINTNPILKLNNDNEKNNESKDANSSNNETITSPINELLYGIKPIELTETTTSTNDDDDIIFKQDEKILEEICNKHPEFVYHIAKGKDGRKYLRVVRNLLLEKGKFIIFNIFPH